MGEGKDLLASGSLVPGGGSDADGLTSLQVRELELEGKSVPGGAGGVTELELVGVSVHLVDAADLGDAVEVSLLGLSVLECDVHVLGENVVLAEVAGGPLAEGGEESGVLLLNGGSVAGVGDGGEVSGRDTDDGGLLGGEEGP